MPKNIKDLQQKIEERFEEKFIQDQDGRFYFSQEPGHLVFADDVKFFIFSELETALREFAETVRVEKRELLDIEKDMRPSLRKLAELEDEVWNSALAEQEEKIKRFLIKKK